MKSGSLCALLETSVLVSPQRNSSEGSTDKLSRHNQVIQTEWPLSQKVFNLLFSRWVRPHVDLFATQFIHKLPTFVSTVLDSHLISKVMDQGCHRMILISPGWPNMPWFWDLVNLSVQIPFRLPLQRDLVTQPFNSLVHRSLSNLNLHAWLLEPLIFRNKGSLTKW